MAGQRAGTIKFILGMTLLVAVFVALVLLGNWQVRRYHLKLGIAHDIATRVHAPMRAFCKNGLRISLRAGYWPATR